MKVPWEEVEQHVNATNPHRGARDFWSGAPPGLAKLSWSLEPVSIENLPEVFPISKQDVRRYATFTKKHGTDFPPIVVRVTIDVEVIDGSHRIAAAESLGHEQIMAYVGRDNSKFARSWKGI